MKTSTMASGRICVHVPGHPAANNRGYVLRARYVMEQALGRYLREDEEVHHKDGDKHNDVIENLQVMSCADHARHHCMETVAIRKVDYSVIEQLMKDGLGYKRIAKRLGANIHTVQAACRSIRKKTGLQRLSTGRGR